MGKQVEVNAWMLLPALAKQLLPTNPVSVPLPLNGGPEASKDARAIATCKHMPLCCCVLQCSSRREMVAC